MASFSIADLDELTRVVAATWTAGADRDWSAAAGTVEWSCTRTATHAIDTVLAPAFFLASRKQDDYPGFEPVSLGADPSVSTLTDGLQTAARILAAVVATTPADVRAVIWRRPNVETRGAADFVPRGGFELLLHAHDICSGLGVPFDPPRHLCVHLRDDTRDWPYWSAPGWMPVTMTGDPWIDLLRASGRRSG